MTAMEPEKKSGFLDRLKDATNVVATKAREGVEELQTKHELSQTYGELGRKAAELVKSGAVSHPELQALVAKIEALEKELAEPSPVDPSPAPASSAPAEPPEPGTP